MVELVRDIRSTLGYIDGDFKTFAIDCGSLEFEALISSEGQYDYVFNLSALKHVRSEKDPFTLMRMLSVNILNTEIGTTGISLKFDINRVDDFIIDMNVFFDQIPSHIHYAKISQTEYKKTIALNQNNHETLAEFAWLDGAILFNSKGVASDAGRYVEIYNASSTDIDLSTGYSLQRWTNGN